MQELSCPLDVEETGDSFAANALLKATAIARYTELPCVADDSGIVVDYLNGEPGIYSARYGGEGITDSDRNALLLANLEGVPKQLRGGRFVCVAALVSPRGNAILFDGAVEGIITFKPDGSGGFGYDPLFFYPPFGCTFARVSRSRKNLVSHRGKAFRKLADYVKVIGGPLFPSFGR